MRGRRGRSGGGGTIAATRDLLFGEVAARGDSTRAGGERVWGSVVSPKPASVGRVNRRRLPEDSVSGRRFPQRARAPDFDTHRARRLKPPSATLPAGNLHSG